MDVNKGINYSALKDAKSATEALRVVESQLVKFKWDDPPYISNFYIDRNNGGCWYLQGMEEQAKRESRVGGQPFRFKLRCIRDEWGNPYKPGDIIERKIPINRKDLDGKPIGGREINQAMRNGSYEDKYERTIKFTVDKKCCIECGFEDAGYFLLNWGIHGVTGYAITYHQELSTEPVKYGQGSKYVHYWRFAEMTKEMYNELEEWKGPEPENEQEPTIGLKKGKK